MSHALSQAIPVYEPDIEHLITEDDEPVDNISSEKQPRLLTESLYSSWKVPGEGRTFLACANVGIFYLAKKPAIVPDVLLSLDVEAHQDIWAKEHRSYFLWEFGKPPDVVIEIVSNKVGHELDEKLRTYERMKVGYYVVFDPDQLLSPETLVIHRLEGFRFEPHASSFLPEVKLGLTIWEGEFEGVRNRWLRWTDERGTLIPTGKERVERLAAKLREMGQDPDQI
jgi:hypothetical protein